MQDSPDSTIKIGAIFALRQKKRTCGKTFLKKHFTSSNSQVVCWRHREPWQWTCSATGSRRTSTYSPRFFSSSRFCEKVNRFAYLNCGSCGWIRERFPKNPWRGRCIAPIFIGVTILLKTRDNAMTPAISRDRRMLNSSPSDGWM